MADTLYLVKNDTAANVHATITRQDTGLAVDLSGATTVLKFKKRGGTSVLSTLTAQNSGTNLANGIAKFNFSGSQLNVDAGNYVGEIQATFGDGTIESVYEQLDFFVRDEY